MLQAEVARGDHVCLEKSAEPATTAQMYAVQISARFAEPHPLIELCDGCDDREGSGAW